jgi:OOP family OmpA-OmpF porin
MNGRFGAILVVLSMSLSAGAVARESGPQAGQFFLSPLAGFTEPPSDLGYDDGEIGYGFGAGYMFGERIGLELTYFKIEPELKAVPLLGSKDGSVEPIWLNVHYLIPTTSSWQPYLTAGLGYTEYDTGSFNGGDADQGEANFGLGLFKNLSRRVALRGDIRGVYMFDDEETAPFASLVLSVALGNMAPKMAPDADGDGVPDDIDQCPNTPPGRTVGADGCQLDSDGDGVVDFDDQCPNTPAGAAVDAKGCPLDSDGDGVPDYKDECPDTKAGAKVDARGCYIELEETVTIDLSVEFALNSAEINDLSFQELLKIINFLREYPQSNAVIEGHTDSSGAASYNQDLSERRAQAVMEVLTKSGIDAGRLSAVGFGEERPIASNDTADGMQRNRRVSIVVSGSQTVRQ